MKRRYFLLVDTETTAENTVFDFGYLLVDRQGSIVEKAGYILAETMGSDLFFLRDDPKWTAKAAKAKKARYREMYRCGLRTLRTVQQVNADLVRIVTEYDPVMTAYNLDFDLKACAATRIELGFSLMFDLWAAAAARICTTRNYRKWLLQTHGFTPRSKHGFMSMKTSAEYVGSYVRGLDRPDVEPHTAVEDLEFFELPILRQLLKARRSYGWLMDNPKPDHRNFQVRDFYRV